MPWSNAIGAAPDALSGIIEYLDDGKHPHHKEYLLTPLEVFGVKSPRDFLTYAVTAFAKNSQKKSGRPPVNAATWFVIRMPDGTWLKEDERSAYQVAAREEAGCGETVVGVMNSHRNRLTGAEDINLLAAAFTPRGELVRDRNRDPIRSLRRRMDEVTLQLNTLRKSKGIALIQTMQEVKKAKALERGEPDIFEMLARLPKPPKKITELKAALILLECEITRWNPDRDSISFKLSRKKKAKRFRISQMLEEVGKMLKKLISIGRENDEQEM